MKKILFFDATNPWILVGTYTISSDDSIGTAHWHADLHSRESSQKLLVQIGECLKISNWSKPDLIVTALGPGSFTGIRISVSTARNLSQLWKIPVLGFDSLEIYCAHYFQEAGAAVSVALEAKQNKIYFGFRDKHGFWGSVDIHPDQIPELLPENRLPSFSTSVRISNEDRLFPGEKFENNLPEADVILNEKKEFILRALESPEDFSYLKLLPNYVRGTYADNKPKVYYE
ncbi:tRNA (adenosine(37)-N6)-threonylcarbamoyltransferase complex dimerization subunit type 1 TsaB [Leptospira perolatii]|uniref:tRNA (Adenosine(37)-N6)-threonylcarbamoyltransferase complex dimerization subunit type 1 TsaB n=1 Tax=Leptospira perolatii TaxID=2023191 RepID=A0A2M9ZRC3_9LEPT|nr:tRNA (adenosine(37)-N6)-threonylcarbamoyltransferase complex dimerization subunit type 1 TsaB [Leptospira perolatii]PJZ71052.1 tRNA (adenosine(37)-N6)-threonylcarbamoyltransferase complex dimerization subunit type 1 TsaB [Leptospira perolatii]PJZ74584.1 tRNA (adenosine(37)-N6)-threonylcarbamoyltransferase complex dimerization subunit type 1 TsaB [Leptospira perolatii]